jgi:NDP-sugar pyrophosphorylase family protein
MELRLRRLKRYNFFKFMKAVLLAAAEGEGLRPMTNMIPMVMVKLAGRPLVWYNLKQLATCGVTEVWMNLYYLPWAIEAPAPPPRPPRVHYSMETKPLGTAGALRNPETGIEEDLRKSEQFIVVAGNVLNNFDYQKMVGFFKIKEATAAMNLQRRTTARKELVVKTNEKDQVVMVEERKAASEDWGSEMVGSEVYVCSPRVLDYIPRGEVCDMGSGVIPKLVGAGERVVAKDFGFYAQDIGSMARLEKAKRDLKYGLVRMAFGVEPLD